jgi:hypothetical protein
MKVLLNGFSGLSQGQQITLIMDMMVRTYDANEFVDFTVLIKRKILEFKVEHCL